MYKNNISKICNYVKVTEISFCGSSFGGIQDNDELDDRNVRKSPMPNMKYIWG